MPNINAEEILKKYTDGTATDEEKRWVETWYLRQGDDHIKFSHDQLLEDKKASIDQLDLHIRKGRTTKLWPKIAAAASFLIVITASIFYFKTPQSSTNNPTIASENRVAAGNRAVLTLSNGKRINLSDVASGKLAQLSGIEIRKTDDNQLIYVASSSATNHSENTFNTIETPTGGQYQVILPDGSKVWLNASSSLKFPVSFAGKNERKVELDGEGYFEVAKDSAHPFHVLSAGQEITVLGTQFNVNSYSDEPSVKTTLVEGSVSVSANNTSKKLVPGQQSVVTKMGIALAEVDPEEAISWKNGYFYFNNADLKMVMRQISRWYDVKVVYEGVVTQRSLNGKIYKEVALSEALQLLTYFKVKFRIEGKTVFVKP